MQVVFLLAACFLGLAFCLPFNAAALPDGWHYNGDVARTPNLAIAVRYNFLLSDFIFFFSSGACLAWPGQEGAHIWRIGKDMGNNKLRTKLSKL